MKIFTFLVVVLTGILTAEAQDIVDKKNNDKNLVFLEVGGRASLYSINYERIVHQFGTNRISIKGGFGYFPRITKKSNENGNRSLSVNYGVLYFPFGVSWIKEISHNYKHFIEIGLNETLEIDPSYDISGFQKNSTTEWVTIPSIGYRYQNTSKLFCSIAYTPHIRNGGMEVWFGVSIGKSF